MIKSLHITNFQSHKASALEFSPGVNIIVGTSDSGKSAIIRALKWVKDNRPNGEAFRSSWGGPTAVTIATTEGQVITRGKTDSSNVYKLGTKTFEAFGASVPDEIQEVLDLGDTNVQYQFDSPFLISNSPGEVAQYFNKIANLDQIDTGIRTIQSQIRSITSFLEADELALTSAKKELESYQFLDKFEVDLEDLEKAVKDQSQRHNSIKQITGILEQLDVVEAQIALDEEFIGLEDQVDAALELMAKKSTAQDTVELVQDLLGQVSTVEKELVFQEKQQALLPEVESILEKIENARKKSKDRNDLQEMLAKLLAVDSDINTAQAELLDMEEAFQEYMPSTCPLCNQQIEKT